LAHDFEDARSEFGELIQKQNTPVSQRYFTGLVFVDLTSWID
jgi:hypothetical protein